jgi:hypothetical protein
MLLTNHAPSLGMRIAAAHRSNGLPTMDRISSWKLADELTVYQIALLIAGYDPSEFEQDQPHMWPIEVTQNISPYLNAIKNAARSKKLNFTVVYFEGNYNSDQLDWATRLSTSRVFAIGYDCAILPTGSSSLPEPKSTN